MVGVPRRPLGSTGLQVSVLGFGASPLGGVFTEVSEAVCIQAVHSAFQAGINYFDTSPYYGATKSETMLGKCLAGLPRDQIVVATKVGRYGAETFDFSAERVTASVHESLARLQLTYIDVIQCHDIEFGSLDQVLNEALPALVKLKALGLVRHIGITGYPMHSLHYILDRAPPGKSLSLFPVPPRQIDLVLSYCRMCLCDRTLAEHMDYFLDKGVGVINASPLSMGLLTEQGPPDWHPARQEIKDACRAAAEHAKARGSDVSKIAVSAVVGYPNIATTLVGMASPEIVALNVGYVLQAFELEANPKAALEAQVAAEVAHQMTGVLSCPTWPSGRPENSGPE
ncbi:MAG: hypothetical protein WDW38_010829 [Sanguina aurantia]